MVPMVGGAEEQERILAEQDSVEGRELVAAASQSLSWRAYPGGGCRGADVGAGRQVRGFYSWRNLYSIKWEQGCRNPGDPCSGEGLYACLRKLGFLLLKRP